MTATAEIEDTLAAWLAGLPGLSAVAAKVFPIFAPDDPSVSAPYVIYRRTTTTRQYSQAGPSNPVAATFRLTCWGTSYAQARDLAKAIRTAVHAMVFPAGVQDITIADEADAFEPSPELLTEQYHGRYVDLEISHDE